MERPPGRIRWGAFSLAICTLAAAALMVGPHRASAETIVAVDHLGEVYEGALGGELESLTETGVSQAAFDGTGKLWLSIGIGEEGCYLTSPDEPGSEIIFDSVSFAPIEERRGVNGCRISTAPGAALLFDSDNGSAASSAVWRLDLATLQAGLVHGGMAGAASPDGRVAISQYRFYRSGLSSYSTLLLGRLGQETSIRAIVHQAPRVQRDKVPGWSAPSFAPNGRLAAVRYLKNGRSQLVVGRPRAWRVVWQPRRAMTIAQTGWSANGDLLVTAGSPAGGPQLYMLPRGKRGSAQVLYEDVSSFTLGPDRPLPSTLTEPEAEAP